MDYALELVDDFIEFLHTQPEDQASLAYYLEEWFIQGDAIELVAGSHARFLRVAFLIANRLITEPEAFGCRAEQISFVGYAGLDELPMFLDPDYWELFVFRRKYGGRSTRRSR